LEEKKKNSQGIGPAQREVNLRPVKKPRGPYQIERCTISSTVQFNKEGANNNRVQTKLAGVEFKSHALKVKTDQQKFKI